MEKQLFYRVGNIETNQGLWYNWEGEYTGLIHKEFDFCSNSDLPMPHDDELVGWLSATGELKNLWNWFTKEDIFELQKHGWYLYVYFAENWKSHENHVVIEKETSIPLLRVEISENLEMENLTEAWFKPSSQSPQRAALTQ